MYLLLSLFLIYDVHSFMSLSFDKSRQFECPASKKAKDAFRKYFCTKFFGSIYHLVTVVKQRCFVSQNLTKNHQEHRLRRCEATQKIASRSFSQTDEKQVPNQNFFISAVTHDTFSLSLSPPSINLGLYRTFTSPYFTEAYKPKPTRLPGWTSSWPTAPPSLRSPQPATITSSP